MHPGPLDEHSAVMREDGIMFIFGGYNSKGELSNSVYSFNTKDNFWRL